MKNININASLFEKPISKFKNYFKLLKYNFSSMEIETSTPCIFLSQKTNHLDKHLITKCIKNPFVFLKDETIYKLSKNLFSNEEENLIINEITHLTENGFSISIIYGEHPTIFGENETPPTPLILFLQKLKLNIKFLTFPGLYFEFPFWANISRQTKISSCCNITIKHKDIRFLKNKDLVELFQKIKPSSVSKYLKKYPIQINSNRLADGLEKVVYCCPHCKKLLTLYSEYSCLKCKSCGNAVEFSNDGKILFSKEINSFDDIEKFQYSNLLKTGLTINALATYNKITQIFYEKCKIKAKIDVILQIYAEKLIIQNTLTKRKTTIEYEDIEGFIYLSKNLIKLKTKNAKEFYFSSNLNENFLIIRDLIKLNKN